MTWTKPTTFPIIPPNSIIAVDTETYCEDLKGKGPQFITGDDYPIGISLAYKDYKHYFPIAHKEGNCELPVVAWFKELLSRRDIIMVGANTRFDLESLWKVDIIPSCMIQDIQILDALIDENQKSYTLNNISLRYGFPPKSNQIMEEWMIMKGLVAKGKPDYSRLAEVPPEIVGPYAEDDAALTLMIYHKQIQIIEEQNLRIVAQLESDLIPVLFDMRVRGIRVDVNKAQQVNDEMKSQLKELWSIFPKNLDPWSSQSLSKWIGETFGLAIPTTTKGNDSIDNEWLATTGIPELAQLREWRRGEKIRRDFVEGLVLGRNKQSFLHPNWFQTRGSGFMSGDDVNGTRSGRIACTNPNLTQIPNRHPVYSPMLRQLFLAEGDWIKGDYNSQEPRLTVHYAYLLNLTGASLMRDRYIANPTMKYHQETVNMIKEVAEIEISYFQGKTINLGITYGMGKKKLAAKMNISLAEAEPVLNAYHKGVPYVKELLKFCGDVAMQRGFVKTYYGRRRRFEEYENAAFGTPWTKPLSKIEAANKWPRIRRAGTYRAANSVIQGTAAEQTKQALVNLHKEKLLPLMQVYDEISISKNNDSDVKRFKEIMEHSIEFSVPTIADIGVGNSWAGAAIPTNAWSE